MASKPTATPRRTKSATPATQSGIGSVTGAAGDTIPVAHVEPLIKAHVGQMRAEMEKELQEKLDKLDQLPTLAQVITTNIVVGGGILTLLFAALAYFGDRQDTAVERSASVSSTLTRIENRLDESLKEPQKPDDKSLPAK